MGIKYDKWTTLETHVDDKTESSYTKGFVVGYRLVQLTDGKQIRSDKQAKHGTTVKGIVRRSGSQPALFIIKEGKVTSNDEVTGEYEMIGVGLRLKIVALTTARNAEREQFQIGNNTVFTIEVRDDTQHNISNCTVNPATGELTDPVVGAVASYNVNSTRVYHNGQRQRLHIDYEEFPGNGSIMPITFVPDETTVVDCDREINATAPVAMTYEKVP